MNKQIEALKLALEALTRDGWQKAGDAIRAIREALAEQPAHQKPVAWRYLTQYESGASIWTYCAGEPANRETRQPLYTSPQPSKPWVGLTDEERDYIWYTIGNSDAHGDVDGWSGRAVMDAIEAKLKEKNG